MDREPTPPVRVVPGPPDAGEDIAHGLVREVESLPDGRRITYYATSVQDEEARP